MLWQLTCWEPQEATVPAQPALVQELGFRSLAVTREQRGFLVSCSA